MEINNRLRLAKYSYILLAVLLAVLGIFLMLKPDFSVVLLCRIGGVLLLAFGAARILGYFSRDLYRLAFQHDLACGILLGVLGVLLLWRTDGVIHTLCIVFGLFILADGLLKIQVALDARAFGIRLWWLILAAAAVTGGVGALLMFRPFETGKALMVLMGASLLAEGLLSLITVLTAVRILQKRPTETDGH